MIARLARSELVLSLPSDSESDSALDEQAQDYFGDRQAAFNDGYEAGVEAGVAKSECKVRAFIATRRDAYQEGFEAGGAEYARDTMRVVFPELLSPQ